MPIPKLASRDFPSPRCKLRHLKQRLHHPKGSSSLWKTLTTMAAFAFLGISAAFSSLPPHYGLPSQNLNSSFARKNLPLLSRHHHPET